MTFKNNRQTAVHVPLLHQMHRSDRDSQHSLLSSSSDIMQLGPSSVLFFSTSRVAFFLPLHTPLGWTLKDLQAKSAGTQTTQDSQRSVREEILPSREFKSRSDAGNATSATHKHTQPENQTTQPDRFYRVCDLSFFLFFPLNRSFVQSINRYTERKPNMTDREQIHPSRST